MALMLVLNTQRPDVGTVKRKRNIHSLTTTGWEQSNENVPEARKYRVAVDNIRTQRDAMNPSTVYRGLGALLRSQFRDRYAKQEKTDRTRSPGNFAT